MRQHSPTTAGRRKAIVITGGSAIPDSTAKFHWATSWPKTGFDHPAGADKGFSAEVPDHVPLLYLAVCLASEPMPISSIISPADQQVFPTTRHAITGSLTGDLLDDLKRAPTPAKG